MAGCVKPQHVVAPLCSARRFANCGLRRRAISVQSGRHACTRSTPILVAVRAAVAASGSVILPSRLRRLLHRPVDLLSNPGHGGRQTGRRALHTARCRQRLQDLRRCAPPGRVRKSCRVFRNVRHRPVAGDALSAGARAHDLLTYRARLLSPASCGQTGRRQMPPVQFS